MSTWNANRPHGFGLLNPDSFAPYPKNPVIGSFFREIDRVDELGSGMRKMMMYGKKYGGADPQLIEGDVFRMIICVPEFGEKPSNALERETAVVSSGPKSGSESIFERVIKELLNGVRLVFARQVSYICVIADVVFLQYKLFIMNEQIR